MKTIDLFSFKEYDFSKFDNISIDDFVQCKYVILWHFTSSVFWIVY